MISKKTPLLATFVFSFLGILQLSTPAVHADTRATHSSGSAKDRICADVAVKMDLPPTLSLQPNESEPKVLLDWALEEGKDPHLSTKVEVFMSYLKKNPHLGKGNILLQNAFAQQFYQTVSTSTQSPVQSALKEALAQTLPNSHALKNINVEVLFQDYYPYLFVHELKNDPMLATAFIQGLKNGLSAEHPTHSGLLSALSASLKTVPQQGSVGHTVSCVASAFKGLTPEHFLPGQPHGPYGTEDASIQKIISHLQTNGQTKAIFDSLLQDSALIANTKIKLDQGIDPLFTEWKSNLNVQNLIHLIQTDPEMKKLTDTFFRSAAGKKVDQCIRSAFGDNLPPRTQEVYLNLLEQELNSPQTCNDAQAQVVLTAVQQMISPNQASSVREVAQGAVMRFINDYLSVEKNVGDLTGAPTPFNDYYKNELSPLFDYPEKMSIEIYRDNKLLHVENNPNVTQFTDAQLPPNDSDQIQSHHYYIATRTSCDVQTGANGQAAIAPRLPLGTEVKATLELSIKLRASQNERFKERLNLLLSGLKHQTIPSPASNPLKQNEAVITADACKSARQAFLEKRTSEVLVDYILSCFGDSQINDNLKKQTQDLVNPLIRFMALNQFIDVDKLASEFLAPVLETAKQEYELQAQVISRLMPLLPYAQTLSTPKTIDDFTAEQKQQLKCGGYSDCPPEIQSLVERYFANSSHAADIVVEIYDSTAHLLLSQPAHTDIFGQLTSLNLKTLNVGEDYTFKIKLKNEPYALPKVSSVKITAATPQEQGGYATVIDLESPEPFFYGNFENSDEIIDLKDVQNWSTLAEKHPEQWTLFNVDGFTGVNLEDLNVLRSNGALESAKKKMSKDKTQAQVAAIFGYKHEGKQGVYTPEWLKNVGENCR